MILEKIMMTLGCMAISGSVMCATPKTADRAATPATCNLYRTMKTLSQHGVMIGHQDALAYGVGWYGDDSRCDFKDVAGEYPAVFGWELGGIELGGAYSLDSVRFADIKRYVAQVHKIGGVNTISWHAHNPLTGGTAWDVSSQEVVKSILQDPDIHTKYRKWLDIVADFLVDLKDEQGQPIPVIFRPYHEMSGNWFWWCKSICTTEEYKTLWQFTFDYLTKTKGIHHLLWAYSAAGFSSANELLEFYPGDEYVDVLGYDAYQSAQDKCGVKMLEDMNGRTEILTQVAEAAGKLSAITEMGYESVPENDWYTGVLYPAIAGRGLSYVMLWRNSNTIPNHFYCSYPGHSACKDLVKFVKNKDVLTASKILRNSF